MEAFVYIWNNLTDNKKYIGYHKGTLDDGYISSSANEMFWNDFNDKTKKWERQIIFEGTLNEAYSLEQEILKDIDLRSNEWYNNARGAEIIFTDEVKEKIRQHHLGGSSGMLGKKHSEETKTKIKRKMIGRIFNEDHLEKLRKPNKDSSNKRGPKSEEHRKNMSLAAKNRKIVKCPYCDKTGKQNTMSRWHFNNCKLKK